MRKRKVTQADRLAGILAVASETRRLGCRCPLHRTRVAPLPENLASLLDPPERPAVSRAEAIGRASGLIEKTHWWNLFLDQVASEQSGPAPTRRQAANAAGRRLAAASVGSGSGSKSRSTSTSRSTSRSRRAG